MKKITIIIITFISIFLGLTLIGLNIDGSKAPLYIKIIVITCFAVAIAGFILLIELGYKNQLRRLRK